MDPIESPDELDLGDETPTSTERDTSIRGWQSLAERRRQELSAAQAERDQYKARLAEYEAEAQVRQLADRYPDAADLLLSQGGELTPDSARDLEVMQRTIDAMPARVDLNSPRRQLPPSGEPTSSQIFDRLRKMSLPWEGDD
jgi:hypothetical protein